MLLLLDIDGTLVRGATQAHQRVLDIAIREINGAFPRTPPSAVAGRTDPWIVRDMLARDGVPPAVIDAQMESVLELASDLYRHKCPRDLSMFVLPGVVDGLRALTAAGHVLGLVTGNLEGIARVKLERAGLGGFFADAPGGFGSDDEARAALPLVAMARAGALSSADAVVIGDTPLDVACAHACGVRCVAVSTGEFPADVLRAAGADAVVGGLDEVAPVLDVWAVASPAAT